MMVQLYRNASVGGRHYCLNCILMATVPCVSTELLFRNSQSMLLHLSCYGRLPIMMTLIRVSFSSDMTTNENSMNSPGLRNLWAGDERIEVFYRDGPLVESMADFDIEWTNREDFCFRLERSNIHRIGLFAKVAIPNQAKVIQCVGDRLTQVEADLRELNYLEEEVDNYMFQMDGVGRQVIDATRRGGPAKFVNHSCQPNVKGRTIINGYLQPNGEVIYKASIWYFALRDIAAGEEILTDYALKRYNGDRLRTCFCNSVQCRTVLNYMRVHGNSSSSLHH